MKVCIWCQKDDSEMSFDKKAHTIPQSLGGENICVNVCDDCNHFFGSKKANVPSSEVVLKEILNFSRYYLLYSIGRKPNKRYKSEYFDVNWDNGRVKVKQRYKLRKGFQSMLGRQFRKAIYKVFLEERSRQVNDALYKRFDFIREFSRYDLGDYPVYVRIPSKNAVFFSIEDVKSPQIRFTEYSDEMDEEFRVYEYQLLGHCFLIPTSRMFEDLCLDRYMRKLAKENHPFGKEIRKVEFAEDVDYTFRERFS